MGSVPDDEAASDAWKVGARGDGDGARRMAGQARSAADRRRRLRREAVRPADAGRHRSAQPGDAPGDGVVTVSLVSDFILLTDSDDASVSEAVALLDGWSVQRVESAKLSGAVASTPNARAVLVTSEDPSVLRA